jgi:hypothetical protein
MEYLKDSEWHDVDDMPAPKDGTTFLGLAYDTINPKRSSFGEFVWLKAENVHGGFFAGTIPHPKILAWRDLKDFPHELTLKIDGIISSAIKANKL